MRQRPSESHDGGRRCAGSRSHFEQPRHLLSRGEQAKPGKSAKGNARLLSGGEDVLRTKITRLQVAPRDGGEKVGHGRVGHVASGLGRGRRWRRREHETKRGEAILRASRVCRFVPVSSCPQRPRPTEALRLLPWTYLPTYLPTYPAPKWPEAADLPTYLFAKVGHGGQGPKINGTQGFSVLELPQQRASRSTLVLRSARGRAAASPEFHSSPPPALPRRGA